MRASILLSRTFTLLAVLAAAPSVAHAAGPKVLVESFTGPTAEDVRGAVLRVLAGRSDIELISTAALMDGARREGVDLDAPAGRARIAELLGVAAIVRGEVLRASGRWTASIEVVHRATSEIGGRFAARAASIRGLDDAVTAGLWRELGGALRGAPVPSRARRALVLSEDGPAGGLERLRRTLEGAQWLELADFRGAPPSAPKMLAQLARDRELDAFFRIELERRRRRWQAKLTLIGPDGSTEAVVEAEGRRTRPLAAEVLKRLPGAFEAVAPAPPPPPPTPSPRASAAEPPSRAPAETESEATAEAPAARAAARGLTPLEVGASVRLLGRSLSYSDDLFGGLRPYDLTGAPVLRLEGAWYPGAHVSSGPASWFGVEVQGDLAFGLSASNPGGQSFGSSAFALLGGLRGRIPLGIHEIGVSVGAGLDAFGFDDAEDGADPDVPDADYSFVRVGADGRVGLTESLVLRAGLGWRQVLGLGELGSDGWFPNASAAGVDARLRVGYELFEGLEAQVGGEYRRYFSSFEPRPGDFPVAGGATDQRWSFAVGASYRL